MEEKFLQVGFTSVTVSSPGERGTGSFIGMLFNTPLWTLILSLSLRSLGPQWFGNPAALD